MQDARPAILPLKPQPDLASATCGADPTPGLYYRREMEWVRSLRTNLRDRSESCSHFMVVQNDESNLCASLSICGSKSYKELNDE
jgi:hypothetical protein